MKCRKSKTDLFLLISIACSFCLFSVGFSSFLIGAGSEKYESKINFHYGNVIIASDYLSLNTAKGDGDKLPYLGVSMFNYNSYGFVVDETIVYSSMIKYYIKFDTLAYYNDYSQNNLNFDLILSYSNDDISNFSLLNGIYLNQSLCYVKYVKGTSGSYFDGLLDDDGVTNKVFNINGDTKTIEFSFDFTYNQNDYLNTRNACWFEIAFYFDVLNKENFSNLYTNEFNANSSALYNLKVGIDYVK